MLGRLVRLAREGSRLRLYLRTREGKVKVYVDDFTPYFYVPDPNGQYIAIDGTRVRKVHVQDPSDVPKAREKYQRHYEADIPYTRRFLIDAGLKAYVDVPSLSPSWREVRPAPSNNIPLRLWFVDIEVKANVLPDPESPSYPIHSITIYDSYLRRYISLANAGEEGVLNDDWLRLLFKDEASTLKAFSGLASKLEPDVFVAWNVDFDYPYLINRASRLNVALPLEGVEPFDLLSAYRKLYRRRSYRLKSVAFEEGLIGEEEAREGYDPNMSVEALLSYNKRDVEVMVKLDERYKLVDYYLALKEAVGVAHLMDALTASVLIDTELLRLARERGVILPSKHEGEGEGYEGAIVFAPQGGLYENVAVFDMTTYYPSIILSFNISPDTLSDDGEIRYGSVAFRKEPLGLLPELCRRFLQLRRQLDDELAKLTPGTPQYDMLKVKRDALKFLVNAVYGYTGFDKSRIYDVRLASTVSAVGREGLLKAKELAEMMGYRVLAGDTDSIMVQVPFERAEELVSYLNEGVRKYFKEKYGLPNVEIGLKFEAYYDRVLFLGVKKRYAAHITWEKGRSVDYIKFTGLEAIRSDESKFAQEFQRGLVELALRGASHQEILAFIGEAREEMRRRPLIEIALNEGLHKALDEYKSKAPHVRAALWSNIHLGTNFKRGDRVYYVWVKGVKGYPPTDVVAFDVDTRLPELIVDWPKMEEANIYQKAEPILRVLKVAPEASLRRWLR
jgi:DNA polymerase I